MNKYQLVLPMALYVFYIWCIALYMFSSRLKAIKSKSVSFGYFKTYSGTTQPPAEAVVIARHYDNQFQVPLLFFITCAIHMIVGMTNTLTLALAWGFVVSRFLHGLVHLGSNNVRHRVAVFATGWLLLLGLWIQLVCIVI